MKKYKRVVDNKMKWFGDTDVKKRIIKINKSKSKASGPGELLDSIFHEELHRLHPKMKEKTVQKLTSKRVKKLSKRDKKRLYSRFK